MAESTADIASAVSSAASGPNTPDSVTVKRPVVGLIWSLFVTLLIIDGGIASVIWLLASAAFWAPNTEHVALARINGIAWCAWLLCVDLMVLVFAIASPWVGQVTASAGNNKIELLGRTGD